MFIDLKLRIERRRAKDEENERNEKQTYCDMLCLMLYKYLISSHFYQRAKYDSKKLYSDRQTSFEQFFSESAEKTLTDMLQVFVYGK